uniref:Glycine rich superfamily member n=1 Tax=Rhipicephalus appendiculatus TaxID=34631 RepID=A0A131YHS1_RHIAP
MIRASVLLLLVLGIVAQASAYRYRFRYLKPGGPPPRDTMPPQMDPNGYYPIGVVVPMPRGGGIAPEYYATDNIGEMPGVTYMPPIAI